jgi:CRISPR-associated endonuclease Csn1
MVIERQKQGLSPVPEHNEKGDKLLFHLSPNDLVYMLREDERDNNVAFSSTFSDQIRPEDVYKIVSFTGNRLYAVPFMAAKAIVDKVEFTQLNKMESSLQGYSVKEYCRKLTVDRLGKVHLRTPRSVAESHALAKVIVDVKIKEQE